MATRRLGLLVFGAAFIVLFLVVAISEGVGDPSVPSGSVALVEDAPGDLGDVTKERFDHALELVAIQGGGKSAPKPDDPKYEELKKTALFSLFEAIWLQGVAEEWGIEVTDQEVEEQLKRIKKESFKSKAEFEKFLTESHFTSADVNERVKVQLLSGELQKELEAKAPTPTQDEIELYYEAGKGTLYTVPPTRSFRSIVNKDRTKVEAAQAALTKDNSAKNWKKLAKRYSSDPNTKNTGGLQEGVKEGTIEEPLNDLVFAAPEGRLEGPVESKFGYTIFEVDSATRETVQKLPEVEATIERTLGQELQQEFLTNFGFEYTEEWRRRTFCDAGYVVERCANFKTNGHPSAAPEACYEADPKGGRPAACPAPVFQLVPAMPGTVSPLEPKGEALAQRPRPLAEKGEGAKGEAGLPEGAVPPSQEAPSE